MESTLLEKTLFAEGIMGDHTFESKEISNVNSVDWKGYSSALTLRGMPPEKHRWYVNWCRQFAGFATATPLEKRTLEDINLFLIQLQSKPHISPWQVQQASDALKFFYADHLRQPWADSWPEISPPVTKSSHSNEPFKDASLSIDIPSSVTEILNQLRTEIRVLHYSIRTEQSYLAWVARFAAFHRFLPLESLGAADVKSYLEYLVEKREIAASTQRQALCALVFLYDKVLQTPLGELGDFARAKKPARLPVVLSREEIAALLKQISGSQGLMARVLYGCGLRLMECVRLRIKDIDFDQGQIMVRDGKGQKDRVTMLPDSLRDPLREHLVRTVQELLGHSDVSTTMIYTHVLNRGGKGVLSPLDRP
jgi:site-specific recombinase XerD